MKNVEKYTKSDKFVDIKAILETVESTDYDIPTLIEFIDEQVTSLARKATKAKEKAAEKKAERDELCEAVANALTAEAQTREQITELVIEQFPDVTVAKVGARLKKLVDAGDAVKAEIPSVSASGKKSTKMAYSLPVVEE